MWLAKIFRNTIETAVDQVVDRLGNAAGAAGAGSRKSQTGSLPLYFAFLIGGFVLLFLTFILRIWYYAAPHHHLSFYRCFAAGDLVQSQRKDGPSARRRICRLIPSYYNSVLAAF